MKKNKIKDFRKELENAHNRYSKARIDILSKYELENAKEISEDLFNMLLKSGVAGIRDREGIKCLHGHFADYIITENNPVGREVAKKIDIPPNCNFCRRFLCKEEGDVESK